MGKWTDKSYITHSEWMRDFGGIEERKKGEFKRLPFNFCSLSLQPVPVAGGAGDAGMAMCNSEGSVYNLVHLLPFLRKYGVDPVTGKKASIKDYFKIHFHLNPEGELHCPATVKTFNENTKIAVVKVTGNVYSYDAIERLNVKMSNWRDLINDEPFQRSDVIIIQDPTSLGEKYNFSNFYHARKNLRVNKEEEELLQKDPKHFINLNSATKRVLEKLEETKPKEGGESKERYKEQAEQERAMKEKADKEKKRLEAHYSTGSVMASFTSTAMTVSTKNVAAMRDPQDVMYEKVAKAGKKGYARIVTNLGDINLELHCDLVSTGFFKYRMMTHPHFFSLCI